MTELSRWRNDKFRREAILLKVRGNGIGRGESYQQLEFLNWAWKGLRTPHRCILIWKSTGEIKD